jgi:hypothetical protein
VTGVQRTGMLGPGKEMTCLQWHNWRCLLWRRAEGKGNLAQKEGGTQRSLMTPLSNEVPMTPQQESVSPS